MNAERYCKYCLEVDQKEVVRSWENGSHRLEISGCSSCQRRHEEEVMALQMELTSLRAAFAKSEESGKESHETELSRITAQSSLALMNNKAKYEQLLSEGSIALVHKQTEYEQLLSQVNRLKAQNDSQRNIVQFLKLHPPPVHVWQLQAARTGLKIPPRLGAELSVLVSVLAAKSPVVRMMLRASQILEQPLLDLLGTVTVPILDQILTFCHRGEMTFSKLVPPDEVLKVAHNLEIGFLKEFCEAELCRRLSVNNVPQMLKLSRKFAATKLQEEAENIFKEHFDMLKTKFYDGLEGLDHATTGRI